jgi:hypothetical protein
MAGRLEAVGSSRRTKLHVANTQPKPNQNRTETPTDSQPQLPAPRRPAPPRGPPLPRPHQAAAVRDGRPGAGAADQPAVQPAGQGGGGAVGERHGVVMGWGLRGGARAAGTPCASQQKVAVRFNTLLPVTHPFTLNPTQPNTITQPRPTPRQIASRLLGFARATVKRTGYAAFRLDVSELAGVLEL